MNGATRSPPPFFNKIKQYAHNRWEQLEADPELAGPWWQLFRQVQSPRHVLSELLQNADDAKATWASARIEDDTFIFEHNGEDFTEDQFASLCRFGFSNKRKLHTIGFRGIGFKSTFSIGSNVDVLTPSLAVRYNKNRFTEPLWIPDAPNTSHTSVIVKIEDENRKTELLKNFEEWANSSMSLLFFNSIKKLTIADNTIELTVTKPGPVQDSEYVKLSESDDRDILVIRSPDEPFPYDAADEIRSERMNIGSDEFSLPPCKIELIADGTSDQRLYVVLPTDIGLLLPFSCNAPFIQDPARNGIKDPSISPTNRWLLERIGRIAASKMTEWLSKYELPVEDRVKAYDLIPESGQSQRSTPGLCDQIVTESFIKYIGDNSILITSTGKLVTKDQCIAPPLGLYDVWRPDQLSTIFRKDNCEVLAVEITDNLRKRIIDHSWLTVQDPSEIIEKILRSPNIPKPGSWVSLYRLWVYLQSILIININRQKLHIFPVEDYDYLIRPEVAVRTGNVIDRLNPDDREFILRYLQVCDKNWIEYIANREKEREGNYDHDLYQVKQLLYDTGLDAPTRIDSILSRAFERLIKSESIPETDLLRITYIYASLKIKASANFLFIMRDGSCKTLKDNIAADLDGTLEAILPYEESEQLLISYKYFDTNSSCSRQDMVDWIKSGNSGLSGFTGLQLFQECYGSHYSLNCFIKSKGGVEVTYDSLPIKTMDFHIQDYRLKPEYVAWWREKSSDDPSIWVKVLQAILKDPKRTWQNSLIIKIVQHGVKYFYPVDCGRLIASWIQLLQSVPCIEDTRGNPLIPAELMLRTAETEPYMDVEPFASHDIDIAPNRELLKLLGVRSTPTGVQSLLDRIRALSGIENPPTDELTKWYVRLDQVLPKCTTDDLSSTTSVFASERLIYTCDGTWATSKETFQTSTDEDIPGIPIIHPSVKHLSLWSRIGVAERPTLDKIIEWLKTLPDGYKFGQQELKRIHAVLSRAPVKIWDECDHWLNLNNTWCPLYNMKYRATTRGQWGDLFQRRKEEIADLRMVDSEISSGLPFLILRDLNTVIDYQITEVKHCKQEPSRPSWMFTLADGLQRIILDDEQRTKQIRESAQRLSRTFIHKFTELKVTAFIEGTPAGQPESRDALWEKDILYIRDAPHAHIYNNIATELSRPFTSRQVSDAIWTCIDRDPTFVKTYLASQFKLEEQLPITMQKSAISIAPRIEADGGIVIVKPVVAVSLESEDANLSETPDTGSAPQPEKPKAVGRYTGIAIHTPANTNPKSDKPVAPVVKDPPFTDQFAVSCGYSWHEDKKCYIHPEGTWIKKGEDSFNMEKYSPEGGIIQSYWISKQSLSSSGVEMPAYVWELLKKSPVDYSIVFEGDDGKPVELTGIELIKKVDSGEIKLNAAKYNLTIC